MSQTVGILIDGVCYSDVTTAIQPAANYLFAANGYFVISTDIVFVDIPHAKIIYVQYDSNGTSSTNNYQLQSCLKDSQITMDTKISDISSPSVMIALTVLISYFLGIVASK